MAIFFDDIINCIGPNDKGTLLQAIAIFTAMETCGSFLTGKTGPSTTKKNFVAFCKSSYMPIKYHTVSKLLYELFRNGVSHSYVPKGAIIPTSDSKSQEDHLTFSNQGLIVYMPDFAKDVQGAINALRVDIKNDETKNRKIHENQYDKYDHGLYWNYMQVFHKLNAAGYFAYSKFIEENNITIVTRQFDGDISISLT